MLKSDLDIEAYTMAEAVLCLNKELKIVKRRPIKIGHFYNLVYNIVKVETTGKKRKTVKMQYNCIVDIFQYMTTKRYPKERKSRANNT